MNIDIIEDEVFLAKKMEKKLNTKGYQAKVYKSKNDFLNNSNYDSDIYIIDICLGDGSGFDVIKHLRNTKRITTPIIITSGLQDDENIVYGLDIGADDYLIKPFTPEVLIARVKALSRRNSNYKFKKFQYLKYKDISYSIQTNNITKGGKDIDLTRKEKLSIKLFIENKGQIITKEDLISKVWGETELINIKDNTLNVIISNIRKKLGKGFKLETIRGAGYLLKK